MDITEYDELDLSRTVVANLDKIPLLLIGGFYLSIFSKMLDSFVLPEMVIIAVFVLGWSVLKIMNMLTYVNLEYKPREN